MMSFAQRSAQGLIHLVSSHYTVRRGAVFGVQTAVFLLAFVMAFLVRFDTDIPDDYLAVMGAMVFPVVAVKLFVFWRMGLFSGWWSFVSLPDLLKVAKAVAISSGALLVYAMLTGHLEDLPRSIPVLDAVFCFLIIAGVRVGTRVTRERLAQTLKGMDGHAKNVVIVGAGAAGQTIVREIRENPKLNKRILGFIDNDPERQNQDFQGVPVLGTPADLKKISVLYRIDLLIASPAAVSPRELKDIVAFCREAKIDSKILPAVGDLITGKVSIQHVRDIAIEDLLGRRPVQLEIDGIRRYLQGKRILVTGAGGSIGSEICRQVAQFSPQILVLVDHAETPLFQIERELRERYQGLDIQPILGDVRDRTRIETVFDRFRPQVVFHAAAYKHVPMSEGNPEEAVRNNVFGTRIVADAADAVGAEHFVLISTDKAVNPTNIMGASKRVAELYVQDLARQSATRMVTVRFGNVLGSNGSVVPIFREQIRKGGPVQVTHPEVTRFFMTIAEAVQLVLQAGSMGEGGEIFLLDMGESVRIVRLAEEMIRLSGLRPYEDIDIVFTGLRPGEKLYEELLIAGEGVGPTRHEKIRILNAVCCDRQVLHPALDRLERAVGELDRASIQRLVRELVPEYRTPVGKLTPLPAVQRPARTAPFTGILSYGVRE